MPSAIRRALVVGVTVVLAISLAAPAFAGAETSMVNKINDARASAGKPPLAVYWDLTDDARAHAQRMAVDGTLSPIPNITSVTTDWDVLAQIVGAGPSVSLLFDGFMASSAHRSMILGNFNYVGVGAKTDDAGTIWMAIILMRGPDDLLDPPDTTTTTTTQPPPTTTTTTQPPGTTTTTEPPGTTTTTTEPPATTTTTQLPGTTTTTTSQPPGATTTTTQAPGSTTTTVVPGATTNTTTAPPPDGTEPGRAVILLLPAVQFAALDPDWIPPSLLRPMGLAR